MPREVVGKALVEAQVEDARTQAMPEEVDLRQGGREPDLQQTAVDSGGAQAEGTVPAEEHGQVQGHHPP